jgi:hypothetical protein
MATQIRVRRESSSSEMPRKLLKVDLDLGGGEA